MKWHDLGQHPTECQHVMLSHPFRVQEPWKINSEQQPGVSEQNVPCVRLFSAVKEYPCTNGSEHKESFRGEWGLGKFIDSPERK